MMMKQTTKRILQVCAAFVLMAVFALMPSVDVLAQTGNFSLSVGQMNTTNGQRVMLSRTTPSVNVNARVTSVTINNINVSSASAPFDFVIISPCGRQHTVPNISRNTSNITINTFNGLEARGNWQLGIQHRGANGTWSTISGARITVNHRV